MGTETLKKIEEIKEKLKPIEEEVDNLSTKSEDAVNKAEQLLGHLDFLYKGAQELKFSIIGDFPLLTEIGDLIVYCENILTVKKSGK